MTHGGKTRNKLSLCNIQNEPWVLKNALKPIKSGSLYYVANNYSIHINKGEI